MKDDDSPNTLLPLACLFLLVMEFGFGLLHLDVPPSSLPTVFLCCYCNMASENPPPLSFGSWYRSAHPWF